MESRADQTRGVIVNDFLDREPEPSDAVYYAALEREMVHKLGSRMIQEIVSAAYRTDYYSCVPIKRHDDGCLR